MKLSFWTLGTPGWSNEQVVEAAKRFGYQGVDLRCAADGNISLQSTDEEIDALRALFEREGIEIASLLAYNVRGNEDGVNWGAVSSDLLAHARLCLRLGTSSLRINVGSPPRSNNWEGYMEGFANMMWNVVARVDGVTYNVQNHPGSLNAALAYKLARLVGRARFGIGFSPDHCVDMGEDPVEMTKLCAPYVKHVHLADRAGATGATIDGKLRAVQPGEGIVPNREVIDALRDKGYDGWVSFKWEKPTYPDLPDAEEALPKFVSYMSTVAAG